MKGNRRKSGTVAACAAIAVLVGAVLGGGPALAEEHHTDWLRLLQQHGVDPHAEHAEPLVEEVQTRGNRFEAMAGEADETSESDSAEIIEEVVYTSDVAIPSSSDGEITLTSDAGDLALTLPEPGSSDREVLTERVSVFAHGDGSSSVPIVRDNGFQVVTVISGSDAPTSYTYELDLNGGRMELTDAGSVAVYDAADGFVGAFDAPWATDDEGRQVATSFSIQGSYLVQSVEHGVPGVAYPVVADPNYSSGVLSKSTVSAYKASNPGYKVSAWLSAGGRTSALSAPWAFSQAGWGILKKNHPGYVLTGGKDRPTMKQQWDCHVAGWFAEWGSFDLETGRASNPNWGSRIGTVWPASLVCNW